MPTRHLTQVRTFWRRGGRVLGPSGLRGALLPTLVAGLCLPLLLAFLPRLWVVRQVTEYRAHWLIRAPSQAGDVETRWMEPLPLQRFRNGDEPGVVAVLQDHPLVRAIASTEDGTLWLRRGDRLVRAGEEPEARTFRRWIQAAIRQGGYEWHPATADNPDPARDAVGLYRQDPWISVRIWRVGSPEVEAHLRWSLGSNPIIRIGLRRTDRSEIPPAAEPLPAWGEPPNLQVNLYPGRKSYFGGMITSSAFGPDWTWLCMESEADEAALRQLVGLWALEARGVIVLTVLALWTGLFLWRRHQWAERADRDRLASMAHSLKTPLGLVKLRCETLLRQGDADPGDTAVVLLRVAEDVDHLTLFIDDSLRGLSRTRSPQVREPLTPSWFQRVADDLGPAFQVEGRTLEVDLAQVPALANGVLLRTALVTLLENALKYGVGPVQLKSGRTRRTLQVEVRNQGRGLAPAQLNHLASPFLRFRQEGEEGFAQEGRGLGLFLLAQVAAQEGWGLAFTTAPGRGFTAVLELPLA
jgi:signal transduction histidine kinase